MLTYERILDQVVNQNNKKYCYLHEKDVNTLYSYNKYLEKKDIELYIQVKNQENIVLFKSFYEPIQIYPIYYLHCYVKKAGPYQTEKSDDSIQKRLQKKQK